MHPEISKIAPPVTVVLVGLGNIGSQIIDSLARIQELKRVVLIDPDIYELSNLASQRIVRRDIAKSKVQVQAGRLAAIRPGLEILSVRDEIAHVPRGILRNAIVLTALHSAESRRDACEAAWRVGSTVIDGGVHRELGLGRVSIYVPEPGKACFECALEEADYESMPSKHVCEAAEGDEMPTNGSASLGSLVAALMVIEAEKWIAGVAEGSLAGRQLVVNVSHHRQSVTRLERNAGCRFDHARREIRPLAGVTPHSTLGDALDAVRAAMNAPGEVAIGVDGHGFARALHCPACGVAKSLFAVPERLPPGARRCLACGGREMLALGFKKVDRVTAKDAPPRSLRRSLQSLGVRPLDVLLASDASTENYFEVSHE
ncbi:MAG: molybdopterin-synthase adenylyltransferase [Verrucomicrobiota bacterium]|jgi:molybdopterin/thiamine biosynthesis adenylyltransferase